MDLYYELRQLDEDTWDVVTPDHRVFVTLSGCTETQAHLVVTAMNNEHRRALGR